MINAPQTSMTFQNPHQLNRAERLSAIAGIFRAGRKLRGYSQVDVAKYLGSSQSWISKVESAQLIPNADQWFDACQYFRISSEDSFYSGIIDNCQIASNKFDQVYPESHFKVPSKYKRLAASKVRAMRPLLRFFEKQLGPEALERYLISEKIDPDFFLVMDNQISIHFLIKLLSELNRQGVMTPANLEKLTEWVREPAAHGKLHHHYDKASSSKDALRDLIRNSQHYDSNFEYLLADETKDNLTLSITPYDHIDSKDLRADTLDDLICRYKKEYFKQFTKYGSYGEPAIELVDKECIFRGNSRCTYELRWVA